MDRRHPEQEGDGIHLTAAELISLRPRCHALRLPMRQAAASALAGAYRSRFRGRGVDFLESRNYQPGDDIRNMDWRVTARTGKPHTKVFQEERERPVLVVMDASPSLFFGTKTRLKSVAAGQLAAAVAWSAVRRGDRIGGFLFAPGKHRELRPAGGRRGAMRMIQGLVDWLEPSADAVQNAEPLSCKTISGLPCCSTAFVKVSITRLALSASSTPWPVTNREQSSRTMRVKVSAR